MKNRTSIVEFRTFLLFLLSLVMETADISKEQLDVVLERMLRDAVAMCNADRTKDFENKEMEAAFVGGGQEGEKINDLQKLLFNYCVNGERARYEPFCILANRILEMMPERRDDLKTDLRPPRDGDDRLIFQRNDPKAIISDHLGIDNHLLSDPTVRKPDVTGLALYDALLTTETYNRTSMPTDWQKAWKDHAFGAARKDPKKPITFRQLRVGLEFKDAHKAMTAIPLGFDDKLEKIPARNVVEPIFDFESPATAAEGGRTARGSIKRKSDVVAGEPSKKPKKSGGLKGKKVEELNVKSADVHDGVHEKDPNAKSPERKLPPNVQVALYAAERLSSSIDINHSLQFVIIDSTIWLWWFDRCGAIQSGGMNFFTNLPYLVVLLDILRRFDKHAWGVNRVFQETQKDSVFELKLHGPEPQPAQVTVTLHVPETASYLHLFNRGTAVVRATSEDPCSISPNQNLSEYEMVAKVYHVDESRESEMNILAEAYKVAAQETEEAKYVRGHLPVLFASRDWEDEYARRVEMILGVSRTDGTRRFRRLRVLLFQKLQPIYKLSGKEFMKPFRDCFLCHGALWLNNIHHRDISENNLMFTRVNDAVVGVLNDFDLSIFHCDNRRLAKERAGTIPFMSHALLMAFDTDEKVPHLYEYDVESFAYVGLWITGRYRDGKVQNHDAYQEWTKTMPAHHLAGVKRTSLTKPVKPTGSYHTSHFRVILALADQAAQYLSNTEKRDRSSMRAEFETDDEDAESPAVVPESAKAYFDRLSSLVFSKKIPSDYRPYFETVDTIMKDYKAIDGLSRWSYRPVGSEQEGENALLPSNDPQIVK